MAVVNITPDSFSDGGCFFNVEKAFKRIKDCIASGADIIDIGGQSTRPGAQVLSSKEEYNRVIPLLKLVRSEFPEVFVSVDTFYSDVAQASSDIGAHMINDISGGRLDPQIINVLANSNMYFVITHSRGNSQTMMMMSEYNNLIEDIYSELMQSVDKALKAGVYIEQIIIDPGLGFAKDNCQNLDVLAHLERFTESKYPVLVGPSRKGFIGYVLKETDPNNRIFGTSAVICRCVQAKVDIVRVHDVKEISQTITMSNQLWPRE